MRTQKWVGREEKQNQFKEKKEWNRTLWGRREKAKDLEKFNNENICDQN